MWLFKKIAEYFKTADLPLDTKRIETYQSSITMNGVTSNVSAGIKEDPVGRFSPWIAFSGPDARPLFYYPKRVPMTEERAREAANALGEAHTLVTTLSHQQAQEDNG